LCDIVQMNDGDRRTAAAQNICSGNSSARFPDHEDNFLRSTQCKRIPHGASGSTSTDDPGNLCINPGVIEGPEDAQGISVGQYWPVSPKNDSVRYTQHVNHWFVPGHQVQDALFEGHGER
jgi:hypothetical protein